MAVQAQGQQILQGHPELFTTYGDTSPFAEAYRSLRINLFQGNGEPPWSLGITGAAPGHGSSTTAANLALIMGEVRSRVVLVDCDFLKPSLDRIFNVPNTVGMSSVLKEEATLEDALQTIGGQPLLKILTAGPAVANPAALLHGPALDALFTRLRAATDLVILDMPSVRVVSYTSFLASRLDGLLLVVRSGTTAVGVDRILQRQLKGVRIIGAVLNKVPTDVSEVASYRDYARYSRRKR
jgi:capsular exopolysaccharide synthesis family protein